MIEMTGIGFVGVIFILVLLGAIALIVFLVSRNQAPLPATFPGARETPLQILDRRFAAGEVDAEEYKRARDLLSGGGPKT